MGAGGFNEARIRTSIIKFLSKGGLIKRKHFREMMIERNFNDQDVINVLAEGKINSMTLDEKFSNVKVEIEGEDLEGCGLVLQVALDIEAEKIILITGHSPRHR